MAPHFGHSSTSSTTPGSSVRAQSSLSNTSRLGAQTPTRPGRLSRMPSTPNLDTRGSITSTVGNSNSGTFRAPQKRPTSSLASFNAKTPTSSLRGATNGVARPSTTLRSRSSMSNINSTYNSPVRPQSRALNSSNGSSRPSSSLGSHSTPSAPPYSGTIRVSIRPRPLDGHSDNPWTINHLNNTILNPESGEFYYDNVYQPFVSTHQVYTNSVEPIVSQCLDGYNGTVFAYGMTGSGKTYSMQGTDEEMGLIETCVNQIYDKIHRDAGTLTYKVNVSYLEIYNERLFDLLNPESANSLKSTAHFSSSNSSSGNNGIMNDDLKIRDDPTFGVKVVGLREYEVQSAEDLMEAIYQGDSIRRTGGTDFNARSSRSHAVLLIRLQIQDNVTRLEKFSTLCLCDLAGSEKATTQIERRKEGSFINKSLLALGTVIGKLSQQSMQLNSIAGAGAGHIPYRDSKLTRLLQPSLSGNSVVSILCTIHLSSATQSETLNTLRFASRAKNIAVNAKRNEIMGGTISSSEKDKLIEQLVKENEKQKLEIQALKSDSMMNISSSASSPVSSGNTVNSVNDDNDTEKNALLELEAQEKYAQLSAENKILNEQLEHLKRLQNSSSINSVMVNNEDLQSLVQFEVSNNRFYETVLSLEKYYKSQILQIEELKSYISHLEQQLKSAEYKKEMSNFGNSNTNDKNLNSQIKEDAGSNELSRSDLMTLVADQEDEILDLKRSLANKDSIIKALRTSSKVRDMVTKPTPTTPSKNTMYEQENEENLHMRSAIKKNCLQSVTTNTRTHNGL